MVRTQTVQVPTVPAQMAPAQTVQVRTAPAQMALVQTALVPTVPKLVQEHLQKLLELI